MVQQTIFAPHYTYQCSIPIPVSLPNGHIAHVTTLGSVTLNKDITLNNVFHIPSFKFNLISINKLLAKTYSSVTFTQHSCVFQVHDKQVAHGISCNGLYIFPTQALKSTLAALTSLQVTSLWHARLGHPPFLILKKIKSLSFLINCNEQNNCNICPLSKHHALSFPTSTSYATSLFDLVHTDVWGPYKNPTLNKCKYFLTLVDDHSRATWTYLLPDKHHVSSTLKTFCSYIQNHFLTKIKTFRSDNGTEFINSSLHTYFNENGIIHQTSCPYTPQQNARVEGKH